MGWDKTGHHTTLQRSIRTRRHDTVHHMTKTLQHTILSRTSFSPHLTYPRSGAAWPGVYWCLCSHRESPSRLVSSRLVSSHLISSRLVSSHLISSRLISSHSSHLVSSRLVSSHLISSHLISSCLCRAAICVLCLRSTVLPCHVM